MSAIKPPVAPKPYLGKGSVLFDRYDSVTGRPTGSLLHMMNVTKFDVETKDDIAEQYSDMNASSSLIATALKKRQLKLSIQGEDFSPEKLAIVHMATGITTLVTSAVAVVGEVLAAATVTKLGRFFRAAGRNIAAVVVHSGATVAVLNTDYQIIDLARGTIYVLPTATGITDAAVLTIDYTPTVGTIVQVAGAVVPVVTCMVHFDSDPTDGQKRDIDCWRVNFSPTGQDAFIADDYGNWQLDGAILDDSAFHPNAPFYLESFY